MPRRHVKNTAERKPVSLSAALFCTLLLLLSSIAGAQAEPPTGVRPELRKLLQDVEAQLQEATVTGDQEDIDRLIDLKAQLQVVELQAELEGLQRDNTTLREQSSPQETDVLDADTLTPEMAGMQDEVEALNDMQSQTVEQLNSIAEQHAFLLEQLDHDTPGTGALGAAAPSDTRVSARLREVQALNAKFQKLADQQSQINRVLEVVSEEHANLLTALGVVEPPHPGDMYTVREGDSLSRIAQAVYGSGDRWPELLRANPSLTDPSTLLVGTVLTIP